MSGVPFSVGRTPSSRRLAGPEALQPELRADRERVPGPVREREGEWDPARGPVRRRAGPVAEAGARVFASPGCGRRDGAPAASSPPHSRRARLAVPAAPSSRAAAPHPPAAAPAPAPSTAPEAPATPPPQRRAQQPPSRPSSTGSEHRPPPIKPKTPRSPPTYGMSGAARATEQGGSGCCPGGASLSAPRSDHLPRRGNPNSPHRRWGAGATGAMPAPLPYTTLSRSSAMSCSCASTQSPGLRE